MEVEVFQIPASWYNRLFWGHLVNFDENPGYTRNFSGFFNILIFWKLEKIIYILIEYLVMESPGR